MLGELLGDEWPAIASTFHRPPPAPRDCYRRSPALPKLFLPNNLSLLLPNAVSLRALNDSATNCSRHKQSKIVLSHVAPRLPVTFLQGEFPGAPRLKSRSLTGERPGNQSGATPESLPVAPPIILPRQSTPYSFSNRIPVTPIRALILGLPQSQTPSELTPLTTQSAKLPEWSK